MLHNLLAAEEGRSGIKNPCLATNAETLGVRPTYSLGIDVGYASVKVSLVDTSDAIVFNEYVLHKGKIKESLRNILAKVSAAFAAMDIATGAVTGSEGKWVASQGGISHVNEVSAVVEGSTTLQADVRSIIEIGGESAKYVTGFSDSDKSGIKVSINSNCSAGTGSFFEEQVSRLNLKIEDYSSYAARAESVPRIAGRCSVFAKTDIIHHQQEGVPVEDILLGLAYGVIRNYRSAVIKKLPLEKPIMLAGGVGKNTAIAGVIEDVLDLGPGELVVSQHCGNVAAIGAAHLAQKDQLQMNYQKLLDQLEDATEKHVTDDQDMPLPALKPFGDGDGVGKHICTPVHESGSKTECYLGIDIGSTSTNLVLMNRDNEIIAYRYLKTLGDPVAAVRTGLRQLADEAGDSVTVIGAGTTGSGRYMAGRLIGADVVKDEITAQAKAAVTIDPEVDTIFEIGGQDSKFISLHNGVVTDFQMNKVCAAGTGSFIEEQSKKFDIPIDEFGEIAIASQNPVNLGERCTVFIETSVAAQLARGTAINDIASGLCYSIVKNYLNRVVGRKPIGEKIFLQGGIAHNQGVVNAFRALTGEEVVVPPFFSVTGAYGTAILAKEEMGDAKTRFVGFEIDSSPQPAAAIEDQNCARQTASEFNARVNDIIFEGYDGSVDATRNTIGIPRALFTYGMYPMFNAFFRDLGFNVILSEPTSEETVRLGQKYSLDETCYPVKLINGHVAELVAKKVDYIFFPDLYTVTHPGSHTRKDFGCPYMQLAFKMVNRAMELDKKGIQLLAPTIGFSLGNEFMMNSFLELGRALGKNAEETERALQKGMKAFTDFENRVEATGRKIVQDLRPDEKAFVIISKTYGVADPVLNLGIPDRLADMGYKVLAFYNLPESDLSKEHPNMYWPFGQHILEAAQIVKAHPNLYAIFLTHHGCGPDTVVSHYFREIMDGKPYLNIEVDEHSSGVGVITRLEAFVNSLKTVPAGTAEAMEHYTERVVHTATDIMPDLAGLPENATIYVPNLSPYSEILCAYLQKRGINARPLPESDSATADAGRHYTMTNEYFSMAALIGNIARFPEILKHPETPAALLIPQSEGAEVDAQYNRFVRTALDEDCRGEIDIVAPFIEDLLYRDEQSLNMFFYTLLAGDIVRCAPPDLRKTYLELVLESIRNDTMGIDLLEYFAKTIRLNQSTRKYDKTVFAIGEPLILFDDYANNHTFRHIEDGNHRVVYAPLAEYMWMLWNDFVIQNDNDDADMLRQRLERLEQYISRIHALLLEYSPFERDLNSLTEIADVTMGYYSGAFGRYREAKILGDNVGIDGIITVASMYENTGIALNILHATFANGNTKPVLNLTFDGTRNENDSTKIESFLYYA